MRALSLILVTALVACDGSTVDGAPATTGSVAGWVCLGPFGTASAGARVSAFSEGHVVTTEAAADGSFQLDGVAVGSAQVVMTNRVEQRHQRVEVEEDRTAEIGSACAITGGAVSVDLCTDGSVDPEVGTAVRLEYLDFGGPTVATVHGATDAMGNVMFTGLTPGDYRLTVTTIDDAEIVTVEPGQTVLFVDPGCYDPTTVGTITGRICNPIDGEPVGDVPVELAVVGEEDREITTDDNGRFRFDAVPPGSHTVTIKPPLQAPTDVDVTVNAGQTTTLPDACGTDDSGSVAGTVCNPSGGAPAPDVNVRLDVSGEPARFATTSESGYFRFDTVPAGSHQLTIPLPAAAPRIRQVVVAVNEESWVDDSDCDAGALGSVSGRVCNPADGEPVADVAVELEVTGESAPRATETDVDGNFSFESVPPGDHTVVVRPPLQAPVNASVTVTAGNETVVPSPQCGLGPPPDPATLTGVACIGLDSTHPLAGATVTIDFNPGTKVTFSGTDGAYTLSGLNAGAADVTITRGAFTTTFPVTMVADQTLDLGMTHCLGAGVNVAVVTGYDDGIAGAPDDVGAAYTDLGLGSIVDVIDGTSDGWVMNFMSSPANLQAYDVVVINSQPKMDLIWATEDCGLPPSNGGAGCVNRPGVIALESLDAYLQGGGAVYISDWAYDIIRRQFQYFIDFYGNDFFRVQALCGDAPLTPTATVLDENLAIVLEGASVPIVYQGGLDHWAVIDSYSSQPNDYLVPFVVADIAVYSYAEPTDLTCTGAVTTLQGSPLIVATPIVSGGGPLVFSTFRYNAPGGRNKDIIQQILLEL